MLIYTIPILVISEIPCLIFTILDIIKLDCLVKYRIDNRKYPSNKEIYCAFKQSIKIFLIIFFITCISFITMDYINWSPYNTGKFNYSYYRCIIEFFLICIINDFFFYLFHRIVHFPKFYWIHKDHHLYRRNSFSLVNHYLHEIEICIFIIPPIIAPILFNSHIYIVWIYMLLTNFNGIYGHSGYNFKLLNFFLLIDPIDHDNHHKHPKTNFSTGFLFSIIDRLFNTHYKANINQLH